MIDVMNFSHYSFFSFIKHETEGGQTAVHIERKPHFIALYVCGFTCKTK
jgi:hypothetical protein